MNKLFTNFSIQEILIEVIPSFGISLLLAELYFKFGSFALECIAFLGTWYFIGNLISKIKLNKNQ